MAEEYAVTVETEDEEVSRLGVLRVIWHELSGGVGPWGAFRPIFSILVSLVPFVYLGQHFNGHHNKAFGWTFNTIAVDINCTTLANTIYLVNYRFMVVLK